MERVLKDNVKVNCDIDLNAYLDKCYDFTKYLKNSEKALDNLIIIKESSEVNL